MSVAAIEPTPENIAKAKEIIARYAALAERDERMAEWLRTEAEGLERRAARDRATAEPYKQWLEDAS